MPNRLYQTVVHQMRDTIDRTIGVVESSGTILACSDLGKVGKTTTDVPVEQISQGEGFVYNGYSYRPFGSQPTAETAVFVEGTDEQAAKYAAILASSLIIIKQLSESPRTAFQYGRQPRLSSGSHRIQA